MKSLFAIIGPFIISLTAFTSLNAGAQTANESRVIVLAKEGINALVPARGMSCKTGQTFASGRYVKVACLNVKIQLACTIRVNVVGGASLAPRCIDRYGQVIPTMLEGYRYWAYSSRHL